VQLVRLVAVVDVHRGCARLVTAVHHLEVLGAVVEIDRDVIVAGLPRLQITPLGMATEAALRQHAREPPAPLREIAVREDAVLGDDRLVVREKLGDELLNQAEMNRHWGLTVLRRWGCASP
jgi:hypothetical protein